jgi:hypothetical protein
MGDLLTTLRENWDVIAQAPLAFAIWTVVLAALCWAVLSHLKSNKISDLESRLNLRNDEIADYKRKLDGNSPDEAAAQIAALEREVAMLRPRKLSAQQAEAITASARAFSGAVHFKSDASSSDAKQFAAAMAQSFAIAGWNVATPMVLGMGDSPASGIGVVTNGGGQFIKAEQAVIAGLRAAGFEPDVLHQPNRASEAVEVLACTPFQPTS